MLLDKPEREQAMNCAIDYFKKSKLEGSEKEAYELEVIYANFIKNEEKIKDDFKKVDELTVKVCSDFKEILQTFPLGFEKYFEETTSKYSKVLDKNNLLTLLIVDALSDEENLQLLNELISKVSFKNHTHVFMKAIELIFIEDKKPENKLNLLMKAFGCKVIDNSRLSMLFLCSLFLSRKLYLFDEKLINTPLTEDENEKMLKIIIYTNSILDGKKSFVNTMQTICDFFPEEMIKNSLLELTKKHLSTTNAPLKVLENFLTVTHHFDFLKPVENEIILLCKGNKNAELIIKNMMIVGASTVPAFIKLKRDMSNNEDGTKKRVKLNHL